MLKIASVLLWFCSLLKDLILLCTNTFSEERTCASPLMMFERHHSAALLKERKKNKYGSKTQESE